MAIAKTLVIVGIVLLVVGVALPDTTTETRTECNTGTFGYPDCYEVEYERPTVLPAFVMGAGGWFVGMAILAWVVSKQTVAHVERLLDERETAGRSGSEDLPLDADSVSDADAK